MTKGCGLRKAAFLLGLPILAEVVGLMDKSREDDGELSNHEEVLASFKNIGYVVTHKIVNPKLHGIPCSRPRIHFQGLCMQVPSAAQHIEKLDALWSKLIVATGSPLGFIQDLDRFLYTRDEIEARSDLQSLLPVQGGGRPALPKTEETAWQRMHANYRQDLKASHGEAHANTC